MSETFKPGDVVQLKSGSPQMVVEAVNASGRVNCRFWIEAPADPGEHVGLLGIPGELLTHVVVEHELRKAISDRDQAWEDKRKLFVEFADFRSRSPGFERRDLLWRISALRGALGQIDHSIAQSALDTDNRLEREAANGDTRGGK